jgi:RNA polymerase sigma factor (TIGR02999 family)
MRRILIEGARRKQSEKHGGRFERQDIDDLDIEAPAPSENLLAVDEALTKLEAEDPIKAQLVKLRFFAGLTEDDAASVLGLSRTSAQRYWRYAKAWLLIELGEADDPGENS